ncbi:SDR family NAD(P)-dependent oxidoreductase [Kitasatospora sp. NPDC059646]|uniref:SDR family NAD(P)-dependent oxidoreductase n=1 Tax=Kitasatospora sp. NPDC059646 TaxID=3346893 RepID=UPI00368FDF97
MLPIDQQTILLTGATDGLGRALAHELAAQGATLVLHGRSKEKGEALLAELRPLTDPDRLSYVLADFARMSDVHRMVEQVAGLKRLDALVNNAGVGLLHREESEDGHELTFQVNYLAGYVLAAGLAPLLVRSGPSRIVNVTSFGQAPIDFDDPMLVRSPDGIQAYCQSKLAQVMHAIDLTEALRGQGVTADAVHPAPYMPTNMVRGRFAPQATIAQGMSNVLRVVVDPELATGGGRFFNQRSDERANWQAYDAGARAQLRELSERLTGVPFPGSLAN